MNLPRAYRFARFSPALRRPGRWRLAAGLTAVLAAGLLAGCMHSTQALNDPARYGPYYTPKNFHGDKVLPADLRRVLVLPVCGGRLTEPETAQALDQIVRVALQQQNRFEVVALARDEAERRFGAREFSSTSALPAALLERLAASYGVEAVMFVDVTAYQPYRPMAIGFRAKLATVKEVHLLWTYDEIVSVADPAVVNSLRRQAAADDSTLVPVDLSIAALQSPSRLAAFAADAMFRTLPPR